MNWKWRKKKSEVNQVNLLDLVPHHQVEWEMGGEGRAILFKPRFEHPFLVRHLLPRMAKPNFRVRLDAFGTSVWEQIDGQTTVREIGEGLIKQFGDQIEPVYQRLGFFIKQLEQGHFITLTGWPDAGEDGA